MYRFWKAVFKDGRSDDPYIVMTTWESHEAFEAWKQSDEFKQAHVKSGRLLVGKAFLAPPKIEIYEVE